MNNIRLADSFRASIFNLLGAKLRSLLAILGVLIGTAAVVALISSSQLATSHALAQFKHLGTNLLSIYINDPQAGDSPSQANQVTVSDMTALKKATPSVNLVAPYMPIYDTVYFNATNLNAQVVGVTSAFAQAAKLSLKAGRFISFLDHTRLYCVIGHQVAQQIIKLGQSPMGQQIQVGKEFFTVVGVLKKWPPNFFINADINQSILVPIHTTFFLSNSAELANVLFRLKQRAQIAQAKSEITQWFQSRFPDFQLNFNSPEQLIQVIAKQRQTGNLLMIAIGAISLIVGGIGVMNIMLVSVVERRREIGIRMALGARERDILQMFLIESVMLTVLGGFLGVVVGVTASYVIALISGWAFHLYFMPIILGFAVSVMVGILSGFYPAWRAAKLDPIQAMNV